MTPRTSPLLRVLVSIVAIGIATLGLAHSPVAAQGPAPSTDPVGAAAAGDWVVSVGDSYISGEGGRWAGNKSGFNSAIDALGSSAY
ncbi:MAG: hypothetical protein ACYC2O_09485 [Microthrixaceae bacterium]